MQSFNEQVYSIVSEVPSGRVVTYGQIAAMCGRPRAARIVGGIAHNGPQELPWQRVVKSGGHLAEGFPGGVGGHQQVLEQEGIAFTPRGTIRDFERVRWYPND